MSEASWDAVDRYFKDTLIGDRDFAGIVPASVAAGLPEIAVSVTQGRFLNLICQMVGARRVLEFGTLGGYSAAWLSSAVGPSGRVVTLELEPHHAEVARANLAAVGLADRVEVLVGPALESVQRLVREGEEPFDLIFIDADKPNNPNYLREALKLSHPGTVIVVENVVRSGGVADASSEDEAVRGSRAVLEMLGSNPRLEATALQTVGDKGWDGFAIARVTN